MDWIKLTVGIGILVVDFSLYMFSKSQLFSDGIAKQSPDQAIISKSGYWMIVIAFLIGGIFLIAVSTHLFYL